VPTELVSHYLFKDRFERPGKGRHRAPTSIAMSALSDRRMPEGVKNIIEKVRSWTQSGGIRRTCDRDLFVHEYGR
jgi:hypothetical protein